MCIYVAISLYTGEPNGTYVVVAAALVSSHFGLRPWRVQVHTHSMVILLADKVC